MLYAVGCESLTQHLGGLFFCFGSTISRRPLVLQLVLLHKNYYYWQKNYYYYYYYSYSYSLSSSIQCPFNQFPYSLASGH